MLKDLSKKAKEMRERYQNAILVQNKIVVCNDRDPFSRDENEWGLD